MGVLAIATHMLTCADEAWAQMGPDDHHEAFVHHPRIGASHRGADPRYPAALVSRLAPPLLLLALTLACQPPPETGKTDGGSQGSAGAASQGSGAEAPPPACSVEAIQPELARYCDYDVGLPPIDLPTMSWTAPSYHPTATRVITLTRAGLTDPEGSGTVSIQDYLANPPRRLPEPGEMALAIAADVPVTTYAELQRGLSAAGRKEVRILVNVADPQPVPTPRLPPMLENMKSKLPEGANERVLFVAQGVRGYANGCPALGNAFAELAGVAPEDRCLALAERSAAAIVACKCEKGDHIMTMLYALTMGFDPPRGRVAAVPLMLDTNRKYTPPPGMTWGQFAAETFTDTELHRVWIDAVAPPAPAGG